MKRKLITIKINFRGGIISPGTLLDILSPIRQQGIKYVRFGLRQQLYLDLNSTVFKAITERLKTLNLFFEIAEGNHPNIISSYPAEGIFMNHTWVSEGIYKDILDEFDFEPQLKINIADSNQSFTPMLTGNLNWVASKASINYWHLLIRFPKTNIIYEWPYTVYTNDLPRLSKNIESSILANPNLYYDNITASGEHLFSTINPEDYITKQAETPVELPLFNLPYYEGLNRYGDKLWLGIYRRSERFSTEFLIQLCTICLETKVGQLCVTPWKSLIIKGIELKDHALWASMLDRHGINMRHGANELNFQVEDNSLAALLVKKSIVQRLNNRDTRSFGLCIGIKTRVKSEIFSSILIRRRPLIKVGKLHCMFVYDILCSKGFNPNERTSFAYSKNLPRWLLYNSLRKCIELYYANKKSQQLHAHEKAKEQQIALNVPQKDSVFQCSKCLSIYDPVIGESNSNIAPGTPFDNIREDYVCPLCGAQKLAFKKIEIESIKRLNRDESIYK